jgi:hypothetical protein
MKTFSMMQRAQALVNTSVQDMQSGLWNYTTQEDLDVLRIGYLLVRRRREETKCKLLKSKIRKLEKATIYMTHKEGKHGK